MVRVCEGKLICMLKTFRVIAGFGEERKNGNNCTKLIVGGRGGDYLEGL